MEAGQPRAQAGEERQQGRGPAEVTEVTSVVIPRDITVSKYLNIYGCSFYEASVHP